MFGEPAEWPQQDLIAFSDHCDAATALRAYAEGVFPMPLYQGDFFGEMGWWSPMQRGILPVEALRVTRSLRKSAKHYRTTIDADFGAVLERCADRRRPDGWIDGRMKAIYRELFDAGIVHSVEVWTPDGVLAGGLFGLSLGGLFCGETMFHDPEVGRDASKVALWRLVEVLSADGRGRVIDTQWLTNHLASLGALEVDRDEYLALTRELLRLPPPAWPRRTDA